MVEYFKNTKAWLAVVVGGSGDYYKMCREERKWTDDIKEKQ